MSARSRRWIAHLRAAGWDTELAAWLLDRAGVASWLAEQPGDAAEALAAVGFADQRVHKPTARWRLGKVHWGDGGGPTG
eukprot:1968029-Alexandrium_andersonii.AAC.1